MLSLVSLCYMECVLGDCVMQMYIFFEGFDIIVFFVGNVVEKLEEDG